jgi:hypothetical protein
VFFVVTLALHDELARRRPAVALLTEFYLCVSLGGVLGGLFNALLAPMLFSNLFEYPLGLAAAAGLALPSAGLTWLRSPRRRQRC